MRFLELLLFFIACIAAAQVTENHNFRVTTSLSAPPDASIYIKSFTYGGTGCPYGSVGHFISSNSLSAMVIFDYMRPAIGPGIAVTENRKNCQISLAIGADPGWRFRVNGRGTWLLMNMSFGKGISAAFKATYYMSGSTNQVWKYYFFLFNRREFKIFTFRLHISQLIFQQLYLERLRNPCTRTSCWSYRKSFAFK
jgi:hypothetical protein